MITITTSSSERSANDLLIRLLKAEGYALSENRDKGIIHAHKTDAADPAGPIEKITIETVKMLYDEKRRDIYRYVLEKVERPMIEHALEKSEGNQLKAARALGINRNTMRNKIKRLLIDTEKWKR